MDDSNSTDPGTPELHRSPVKPVQSSPRPPTPEPLDLDLSPSTHTKKESSRPKTPKISPAKRSKSGLIRPATPKKVVSPTRFSSRPTSPKSELSPSKLTKSKSQPTSPIGTSPTKRFSLSPGHSPKKLSRSSSRTSPKLTPSPSKGSPQSTIQLLGPSRAKKSLKRFSSLPATPIPATSPAKTPCTPEISVAPIDLPGPSTAPKDLPGLSTAQDFLPAELPEELPEEIPEELPEELAEELPEELPEKLAEKLAEALPAKLAEELPVVLPEKLAKELPEALPEKLAKELPETLSEKLAKELPRALPEKLAKELPEALPEKLAKELPEALPEKLAEELPKALPEKLAEEPAEELPEEPAPDPATAEILPNEETVIEITLNDKTLGIELLGGSDTFIKGPAAVILEVYKEGAAGQDGRLKVGDQIRECNGIVIHEDMVNQRIRLSIKLKVEKIMMTVYRPDPLQFEEIEIELKKKSGKPFGISCMALLRGPGVYVNELIPGSAAEKNGKLQKGDFLVKIGDKDVSNAAPMEVATILKLCEHKTIIKIKRFKIIPWEIPSEKMPKKLTI